MDSLRIVIADDEVLFADGLKTIIELEEDLTVVGMAQDGRDALKLVESCQPHVVLMDLKMPGMSGLEATQILKDAYPPVHVIILTTFDDDDLIARALANGASGFVLKATKGEQLIKTMRDVVKGQLVLPPDIAGKLSRLLQRFYSPAAGVADDQRVPQLHFTKREIEIIRLMLRSLTNKEIAHTLYISEGTVKNYVSVIYSKVGTNDRSKAIDQLRKLSF